MLKRLLDCTVGRPDYKLILDGDTVLRASTVDLDECERTQYDEGALLRDLLDHLNIRWEEA